MSPRRSLTVSLLSFLPLSPAFSQIVDSPTGWMPATLPAGNAQVRALAVSPVDPGRVYLALLGLGVVRTDDGGQSWTEASSGLPSGATLTALVASRSVPDVVLAGSGGAVYLSENGGVLWKKRSGHLPGGPIAAILPIDGVTTLLAAVAQPPGAGVHRTTDGGRNWIPVLVGPDQLPAYSLASSPDDPDLVLAGTAAGVARSTDGGVAWTIETTLEPIASLSWSPADAARVLALGWQSIHRSDDAGISFVPVADPRGPLYGSVGALAAHPSEPDVVLAVGTVTCAQNPFRIERLMVWESENAGEAWTVRLEEGCGYSLASAIAYDPGDAERIYLGEVGQYRRGFRRSTDGGATWNTKIEGLRNFAVTHLRAGATGVVWAYARDLFALEPAASAWEARGVVPVADPTAIPILDVFAPSPYVPELLFRSGIVRPKAAFRFFEKSADGGHTWIGDGIPPGLPDVDLEAIASGGTGQVVYATSGATLYRSDDGAESFADVSFGAGSLLAVERDEPLRLHRAGGGQSVRYSTDGGVTWEPRDEGLPPVGGPLWIAALFLHPARQDELVLLLNDGRIFETSTVGSAWTARSPLDFDGFLRDVTWNPRSGFVYAATSESGVVTDDSRYRSHGLPRAEAQGVAFSTETSTLFVGTRHRGVLHQSMPRAGIIPFDVVLLRNAPDASDGRFVAAPNPARAETRFHLPPGTGRATLAIYDARGRLVRTLLDGARAGSTLRWDGRAKSGSSLPSGVYWARLTTPGGARTARVVLLR